MWITAAALVLGGQLDGIRILSWFVVSFLRMDLTLTQAGLELLSVAQAGLELVAVLLPWPPSARLQA